MKSWDAVIVGGGIIGLSLALSLRKHGADVLIVDKGEPGREASSAAAGMLAWCEQEEPVRDLAAASAVLYPEFIHEIEDEAGTGVDYRQQGAIVAVGDREAESLCDGARMLESRDVLELEPNLSLLSGASLLPEASVDPRALSNAALKAARHRGIEIASGVVVAEIECSALGVNGVATAKTRFPARCVVNCAGAWAGQIAGPLSIPTRPVKGHMLDVIPASLIYSQTKAHSKPLLRHVVRTPEVYLVPRSDGRIVIGSTIEDVGFDKRVSTETIQRLHQAAANVLPQLGEARIHESWTGLRPGTPDKLPILGRTAVDGYFVATGHYRDGILLAPITARVMTQVVRGLEPEFDLTAFSPLRFVTT